MNIKDNLKISKGYPFHRDYYLINTIAPCLERSDYFIETGSWTGESTLFVCENFPHITSITCEPDKERFKLTKDLLEPFKCTYPFNVVSPSIFEKLKEIDSKMNQKICTFWLDAHGYGFDWPLREEISLITQYFKQCYIFIDDFKNPFHHMQYDQHNGQVCSLDYINNNIKYRESFKLYYPNYTENTSDYHTIVGWALLTNTSFSPPNYINEHILK